MSTPFESENCTHAYLSTAVIKESLRMYTSNSPPFERVAPHDIVIDRHTISKGTVVGMPQYVLHRDASIYGIDVEAFPPERWLEADTESRKLMERNFMPVCQALLSVFGLNVTYKKFGKVSRACAGRNLAMLELRTVVTGLLRNFDVQLANPIEPIGTRMYRLMEFTGMNVVWVAKPEAKGRLHQRRPEYCKVLEGNLHVTEIFLFFLDHRCSS